MIETPTLPPKELLEVEQLIDELLGDSQHPVHNRLHPHHQDCTKALDNLIEHAEQLRNCWLGD